jgi:nucleoside phosphorylase
MPNEAYMGRIGGLAVALGIGVAIVSGGSGGLAWADDSPGSAGTAASSDSTGHDSASPDPDDAPGGTDSSPPASASTGTDASDPPDLEEPTTKPADASGTSVAPAADADEDPPKTPSTAKRSDRKAAEPPKKRTPAPHAADADNHAADADNHDAAPTERETDAVSARVDAVAGAAEQARGGASLRTASIPPPTVIAPRVAEHAPLPIVGVVSRVVAGVVNAILRPLAAISSPGTPAGVPSLWAVLAFARREFESAMRRPSETGTRGTTSETFIPDGVQPEKRTLVLTAFPAEADAILARTTLDPNPTVVVDGRHFYLGSMGGEKVIVAMTGIGMVNATHTTEAALAHFTPGSGISIGAVVFAGVAGGSGRAEIGSVAVPARWTADDGTTWRTVDAEMLAAANALTVDLESTATLGDPLCLCNPLARLPLVDLKREPQLFVGGDGSSDDHNNGVAFPAIPFAGSIFGPQPCTAPDRSPLFTGNFFQAIGPFLLRGLLTNLTGILTDVPPAVDAVDQETAAAQQVADAHGIPFLGIRGMSDGPGDPLNLPGYPFTFFVYNQIAADNAAIVTEAFLRSWDVA